jgi:dihydroorotate dehydrogenase electron transfer subunit
LTDFLKSFIKIIFVINDQRMSKRIDNFVVLENKRINFDVFTLELFSESKIPDLRPGQFGQVKVEGSADTFLRRPISIHDVNRGKNTITLLIKIAGRGTEALSGLKKGEFVNIIYPLGNSFSLPGRNDRILLAGGGCGIAPLLFLGKYLTAAGYIPDILLGFRSRDHIMELEEYQKIGRVFLTTDDGSAGEKGFIIDHSVLKSVKYSRIYCCGPEPMMKAIASYCSHNSIECEVSLENLMACGIGACLCCIVDTVSGNLCTCTEGPVFNINDLKW